jgi:hypothetical protein
VCILVTEDRLVVGRHGEIVLVRFRAEHGPERREELAPVHLERVFVGPELLDDLERRVAAKGLDHEEAAVSARGFSRAARAPSPP